MFGFRNHNLKRLAPLSRRLWCWNFKDGYPSSQRASKWHPKAKWTHHQKLDNHRADCVSEHQIKTLHRRNITSFRSAFHCIGPWHILFARDHSSHSSHQSYSTYSSACSSLWTFRIFYDMHQCVDISGNGTSQSDWNPLQEKEEAPGLVTLKLGVAQGHIRSGAVMTRKSASYRVPPVSGEFWDSKLIFLITCLIHLTAACY